VTDPVPRGVHPDIDAVLEDAEVLQDLDDADLDPSHPSWEPEGTGGCRHHRPPPQDAPTDEVREPVCVPACARAIRQTAARDLHLAVSLVVGDPKAAVALARFADRREAESEGALVFGCLLHLAGHTDAAEFWWQFAAGGGDPTAAFCLYLFHRNQGQHRTAQHWRTQSRDLQGGAPPTAPANLPPGVPVGMPPAGPGAATGELPLLPGTVRRALLSQCHQGTSPQLPPALEAAVNSLYGQLGEQDDDSGTCPLPVGAFPAGLVRVPPPAGPVSPGPASPGSPAPASPATGSPAAGPPPTGSGSAAPAGSSGSSSSAQMVLPRG